MPKSTIKKSEAANIKKSEAAKTTKKKPCLILCGQNQLVRLDEAQPDSFTIASLYFVTCVALEIRKGKSLTFAHIDSSTDLNFILEEIDHLNKSNGDADQPITIDVWCVEGFGDKNASKINKFLKNNTKTKELLSRVSDNKCWEFVGAFYRMSDAIFVSQKEDTSQEISLKVEMQIKDKELQCLHPKLECLHPKENGDKVYDGDDLKIVGIPAKGLLYSQILIKYWSAITNLEETLLLEGEAYGTRPILRIFDNGKYLPEFTNPKFCNKAVDVIKDLFPGEISDDNPNIFFENLKNRVRFGVQVVKRNKNINSKLLTMMRDDMVWASVFSKGRVLESKVSESEAPELTTPCIPDLRECDAYGSGNKACKEYLAPAAVLSRAKPDKSVASDLQKITKSFQAWQLMIRKDMAKQSS